MFLPIYTEIFFCFVDFFDHYDSSERYTNSRFIKFILVFDSCVKTTVLTQHNEQVVVKCFENFSEHTKCHTWRLWMIDLIYLLSDRKTIKKLFFLRGKNPLGKNTIERKKDSDKLKY